MFTSSHTTRRYKNAGALIDQCHQVFNEARGLGFADREASLTDALSSYLAGLAAGYCFDLSRQRRYMGECVVILRTLGFQRSQNDVQNGTLVDHIYQQSGRRLFWLCFVSALSVRQLGGYDSDILMPPTVYSEKLPPLPVEVDDEYIYATTIFSQPAGTLSMMCGFNLNVQLFRSFHHLIALETLFGGHTVYHLGRQRQLIRHALSDVKSITQGAPSRLQLQNVHSRSPALDNTTESHALQGSSGQNTDCGDSEHLSNLRDATEIQEVNRLNRYEIQKANIYATQLATRSFLVEKYLNLLEIHGRGKATVTSPQVEPVNITMSPTARCVTLGLEAQYQPSEEIPGELPYDGGEQSLAIEREDIIRDMAVLLKTISQVNMEPNGLSFCNKIRQVASTLLDQDRTRMSMMPSLNSEHVNEYLYEFCNILAKLERLGPQRIRDDDPLGRSTQDAEDEALIHWASLKEHQERFIRSEGFLASANI